MDKVITSSKNVTPFGGLNLIYNAINRSGIPEFLDNKMGFRHFRAEYSYSDIVLSLFGNSVCQGDYISDLKQFKLKFSDQFFTNIPSADTVEYACQELKTTTIKEVTDKGIVHEINFNNDLNNSIVALCVKTKQLDPMFKNYTLDFDNVVVETEKQDAKKSYKKTNGYHPNFAFIGRLPVHIENHNGNTPAKYKQSETLKRCFDNLDANKVKIGHFRADSASYQQSVVELVSQRATCFYIRNVNSESFRKHCALIKTWETIEVNFEKKEVATTNYTPFGGDKSYRIVVTRSLRNDQQIDLLSGCPYTYYGIMTNNIAYSNKEIIEFYNDRGDAENSNRYLLNDFNVHRLPFPDMDMNTVFMYLMAMCSVLFEWTKKILVQNKTKYIKLNMRVKAICFNYITIASTFINHARQRVLQIFSEQDYKILQI
jgi:hypothetical protein